MLRISILTAITGLIPLCTTTPVNSPFQNDIHSRQTAPTTGAGTGGYPAIYFEDPSHPLHTIYMPLSPPVNTTLPVLLWGNGNCVGDGLAYKDFLLQTASHGILIIANGWVKDIPGKQKNPRDTTKDMSYFTDSITWIQAQAGKPGKYETVDASLLGASGHSCGGLQTIEMRSDERVKMLASFGYATRESVWAREIGMPVGFFVGSLDTSIALPQIQGAWPELPATTPAWWGTYPNLGHGGTFNNPNGGVWATSFAKWVFFTLKGDPQAAEYFKGKGAANDGWEVKAKALDRVAVKSQ
ncbi:alpha/beta-hydrolase [Podospora aff. communis PSN243]|uniref:Alpha/beta-hydrolase n=1 Tax=Podospora aff. communis PSN243 TaxID=3040156 RepID=A0AAV9G9Y6_9PEZI|nr:alpha/beta-hydrolase [Podospora aff. communis PSN243]